VALERHWMHWFWWFAETLKQSACSQSINQLHTSYFHHTSTARTEQTKQKKGMNRKFEIINSTKKPPKHK
jgi:hypothetical protein